MPVATMDAIDQFTGGRGFSRFVTEAAEARLRRESLKQTLAEMEAINGPTDPAAIEALERRLAA